MISPGGALHEQDEQKDRYEAAPRPGVRVADQLERARMYCKAAKTVWFVAKPLWDPKSRSLRTVYIVYRRGMGEVARRSSPAALVAYLRNQVPV